MNNPTADPPSEAEKRAAFLRRLDEATAILADAAPFAKPARLRRVFDAVRKVLALEGGCREVEARAPALDRAGVFLGSDWDAPQNLLPTLSRGTLQSADPDMVVIEVLSELRLLAVAKGTYAHPLITPEAARVFVTRVLALNLAMLFTPLSEAERTTQGPLAEIPRAMLIHLAEGIGFEHVVEDLIREIWRILQQRPIQTESVKAMITQLAVCHADPNNDFSASGFGAERLISSLYAPTNASREDPGTEVYHERLQSMDSSALHNEAAGFARAMHDTGLVSPYHPVLLRHIRQMGDDHLMAEALGLSLLGRECMLRHRQLIWALIDEVIQPETAQATYGLALLLDNGVLFRPAVAPAIWRQLGLKLSPFAEQRLRNAFGPAICPSAKLLEGVLCMLGQPLGVGQGNNPTCQSARALSMWAYNDPDYLLQLVAWAARDNEVPMHFEGQALSSKVEDLTPAATLPVDLDPVSLLTVPHLDKLYHEMGRLCLGREGDPHRWINPEFHGRKCYRGFRINVDVATGALINIDDFLRHFYAAYHPTYNGNLPLIHPQPAGIAITSSAALFIGWHAITIRRVARDPKDVMRVYFYNPNNDSGQNWGDGVEVNTAGTGERFGEASLPFEQFASRLYIFHYDPLEPGELATVSREELDRVIGHIQRSWGVGRLPDLTLQANPGP